MTDKILQYKGCITFGYKYGEDFTLHSGTCLECKKKIQDTEKKLKNSQI